MSSIQFPQMFAQCTFDDAAAGGDARTPAIISSGAFGVVISDGGRLGGVGADGTSRPLTGKPLYNVGPQELRRYAQVARGCAAAIETPARQVSLRQLAQELDKMASRTAEK